jgi:hypothetical protein
VGGRGGNCSALPPCHSVLNIRVHGHQFSSSIRSLRESVIQIGSPQLPMKCDTTVSCGATCD